MIHDVILLLWEAPCDSTSALTNENIEEYTTDLNDSEKSIFLKIIQLAKHHACLRQFIRKYSFATGKLSSKYQNKTLNVPYGFYIQALAEGIDEVLKPYRDRVMELEKSALNNPYLSLSYVLSGMEKFRFLLEILNRILFSIKENNMFGCQILNVLQNHSLTGNEESTFAIQKLIQTVHNVFYEHLCGWILYGDLKESGREFFIQQNINQSVSNQNSTRMISTPSNDHSSDKTIRYEKDYDYEINEVMRPYYIPVSLAQKILFIGKSVVLFDSAPTEAKQSCDSVFLRNDIKRFTIWGQKEVDFHKGLLELKKSTGFDVCKLDLLIDEIKSCVTEHLWTVAGEEAKVLHELQLMKDFYLLGRGELFLELLRLSAPLLNSPPNSIATREMNHAFRTAARSVLLGANKDVEKFTFEIPYNPQDSSSNVSACGYDGWATVMLKYDVRWPLHLIFTPEILHQYNEMFRFLLRLKKTQHDLHLMWYIFKEKGKCRSSLWQLHNKLMFLIDHLQHYLQSDVLESNYSKLITESQKINDFEMLKTAHNSFLIDIRSQAFLLMTPGSESFENCVDYQLNPVMSNIMHIMQLCDNVSSLAKDDLRQEQENRSAAAYSIQFETLVAKLLQLLTALRSQPCGMHLARLLMRLDFNRWFSSTAHLTQSVSYML